ncbi:uncharacterized protein LOC124545484 [Schistocerca americana]|uniref:uncharacterized protein LOC124545484 n=1 Tax=Schistocerca americana TaxID=7009 RepID=UPI001F4F6873|nr:uncharacterized protein LOC124545484 [Schistocerca americana]XP_047097689.1 uncharacterized protein LOC124711585 [Schistocerca piceifrons]XP_049766896.1 uncharacterized protein LOC126100326 [Schistocerca cancellata]XP_049794181.1 uncharacterized protein LOC126203849 [Schistocerca nitens]XP_049839252.1 uncharacterized protein LOC126284396 [Schistocerca gregaria]XP_049942490.1 uncharacterized protein LOC126419349 [Schistocerca serialis cubense]
MEKTADQLEVTVQKADTKLDLIAWKLEKCEKELFHLDGTEVSVISLLRGVNQVKEEYENLRREISEVQQLQKQLSDSLRLQLRQVQGRFGSLRERIIKSQQNN